MKTADLETIIDSDHYTITKFHSCKWHNFNYKAGMPELTCPLCTMDDVHTHDDHLECLTCGHEWKNIDHSENQQPGDRIVKDAYGNVLEKGDVVQMIKDLKLKGSSDVLKSGTKSKPISLQDGDHEISCRMNGIAINLKACFVKKVLS